MAYRNVFAQRLRETRMKAGISQAELSRRAGITPSTLSSYELENSSKKPTLEKIIVIAKELNVSIDYLCGLKGNPEVQPEIKIDHELLLRVIAKFVIDNEYQTVSIREITDCIDGCILKDFVEHLYFTSPVILSDDISSFIGSLNRLTELRNEGTFTDELFKMCVEQLIVKTSKDIQMEEKRLSPGGIHYPNFYESNFFDDTEENHNG